MAASSACKLILMSKATAEPGGFHVQSILTGESGSVEKSLAAVRDPKAVYQDKTCLLFAVSTQPGLSPAVHGE